MRVCWAAFCRVEAGNRPNELGLGWLPASWAELISHLLVLAPLLMETSFLLGMLMQILTQEEAAGVAAAASWE